MIQVYYMLAILQLNFSAKIESLTPGQKISKSFAVTYLNADEQLYGQYLEYSTLQKPEISKKFLTLIYKESTGICSNQYIAIFGLNGDLISQLQIESRCDQDMAKSSYRSWSYQFNNQERILYLRIKTETVSDESFIGVDGFLNDGYSFDELKTESIEQTETYRILNDGKILKDQ